MSVGVAGTRLMSTEQQLLFPSENVQASPNRPALNATAPHPGLRIDKLDRTQTLHKGTIAGIAFAKDETN